MAGSRSGNNDAVADWRKRGLWTQDQLAESLGVSRATIDEWKKEGMPHIKKGRFVFIIQSEFLRWMKEGLKEGRQQ